MRSIYFFKNNAKGQPFFLAGLDNRLTASPDSGYTVPGVKRMNTEKQSKIGCVVLASGYGRRYGANKLAVSLEGRSLIRRALEAIPAERLAKAVVVTQYEEVAACAKQYNFTVIRNEHPERGISQSLRLGLAALHDCDGVLFTVADQPLLRQESITALLDLWSRQPEKIASMSSGGRRGNPCLFPALLFPELMALEGDRGGSAVIRRHPEDLVLLEVDALELADVDTPQALEALSGAHRNP